MYLQALESEDIAHITINKLYKISVSIQTKLIFSSTKPERC